MSKVYLAGPISGLTYDEATEWRNVAVYYLNQFGIHGSSPMRGKEFLKNKGRIGPDIYEEALASDKGIVARDHYDVRTCDLMLANLLHTPGPSIGTMVEYGWASAYRHPVITVLEDLEDSKFNHPFIRDLSDFIVPTLQDGLEIAVSLLEGS